MAEATGSSAVTLAEGQTSPVVVTFTKAIGAVINETVSAHPEALVWEVVAGLLNCVSRVAEEHQVDPERVVQDYRRIAYGRIN